MSIVECPCGAYYEHIPGTREPCPKCGGGPYHTPDRNSEACGGYVDNGSGVCEFCNLPKEAHNVSPGNEDGHYSGEYQPKDWGAQYGTPVYQLAKIIKYLARHKKKGRALDLDKAIFFARELEGAEPVSLHNFFNRRSNAFLLDALRVIPGSLERGVFGALFIMLWCGPGTHIEAISEFIKGVESLKQVLYGSDE
jgi:hypothetical protein